MRLDTGGYCGVLRLPINANPSVSFPIVNVVIEQSGAAPAEMEYAITRRVEDALTGLADVRHIQSTTSTGVSETIIEFRLETDPERAVNDVRAVIGQIRGTLPQTILEPIIQRVDVEGESMLSYVLTSSSLTPLELSWYIDNTVNRQLLAIPGVQR